VKDVQAISMALDPLSRTEATPESPVRIRADESDAIFVTSLSLKLKFNRSSLMSIRQIMIFLSLNLASKFFVRKYIEQLLSTYSCSLCLYF